MVTLPKWFSPAVLAVAPWLFAACAASSTGSGSAASPDPAAVAAPPPAAVAPPAAGSSPTEVPAATGVACLENPDCPRAPDWVVTCTCDAAGRLAHITISGLDDWSEDPDADPALAGEGGALGEGRVAEQHWTWSSDGVAQIAGDDDGDGVVDWRAERERVPVDGGAIVYSWTDHDADGTNDEHGAVRIDAEGRLVWEQGDWDLDGVIDITCVHDPPCDPDTEQCDPYCSDGIPLDWEP